MQDEGNGSRVKLILYRNDVATPVGSVMVDHDTLLHYAHVFLEAGLRHH